MARGIVKLALLLSQFVSESLMKNKALTDCVDFAIANQLVYAHQEGYTVLYRAIANTL